MQTSQAPNQAVAAAIAFAREQLGKPYLWGGTGPDAFDCSGLVMMAYRAAGISIPRTSQQQWAWGPQVPASQVKPGDLVFFAGVGRDHGLARSRRPGYRQAHDDRGLRHRLPDPHLVLRHPRGGRRGR